MTWLPIEKAPITGAPFWVGTATGGVLLEAWHWCAEQNTFAGIYSRTTLAEMRRQAPLETFYYAEIDAPGFRRRQ